MVRLAAGIEQGRVYVMQMLGGVTISDPDFYVTVGVMFWFAYFSVQDSTLTFLFRIACAPNLNIFGAQSKI